MAEDQSEKLRGSVDMETPVLSTPSDPRPSSQNHEVRGPLPTDSMVTVPLSDRHTGPRISGEGPSLSDAVYCPDSVSTVGFELGSTDETQDEQGLVEDDIRPAMEEPEELEELEKPLPESEPHSRTPSAASSSKARSINGTDKPDTEDSRSVDWAGLEETEVNESKASGDDVSTTLLLARLEQENNALATDPKSASAKKASLRSSRPPSIQQLKDLVNDPRSSLRYSQLPAPQMTELEFWAALVADYPRTAQRLPTLTSHKIRGGVPPPLRGVVWPSIAGARDSHLHDEFEKLCGETSPYEGLIGKDIGRSFPNVEMFRDPLGEGQQMLGRVLKCFSLYDSKIGYCQGLGFVVGPLLMHMSEAEAFCVLVRLMDHYDLRSCFLPTLSGLHLRIYQFQSLLSHHAPELYAHLDALKIEPVYVSQWFLSFFAVTCPLPMLLRIYDVLLLEGACETLMRVALSLMQRNQNRILACTEFEDAMQLLLSRSLWDPYACNADDLVADFVSLTSLVTHESLHALEVKYQEAQGNAQSVSLPQLQAIASRFLGRFWAGSSSHSSVKSVAQSPDIPTPGSSPLMGVTRTPSKQSMASTLNSLESSTSDASTAPTEASTPPSSSIEHATPKPKPQRPHNSDKDLHSQIEDLLIALTDMQREQAALAKQLQQEREERKEDQLVSAQMLSLIKKLPTDQQDAELIVKADERFSSTEPRRMSMVQTKQQLLDDVEMWKGKYELESTRCQGMGRTIDEHEQQNNQLKDQLKEARARVQDSHREKQRLERTIQELRTRKPPLSKIQTERPDSVASEDDKSANGLREFKLGKASSPKSTTFSKRTSSLGAPKSLAGDEEGLLLELVNSKTSEAIARQELEEMKVKLETLKRLVSRSAAATSPSTPGDTSPSILVTGSKTAPDITAPPKSPNPSPSVGFFTGWTRRTTSTTSAVIPDSK
ncbi:EVI5-like protein [Arthroderma uncinatum]|uniref:EVI5-like protein n=1 Tax=Arthroderma uncinatum TaxID=74035 RepID=UPI00144A54ED|nr:EVI5-like protein [Arthroderma uncinatum]KAF3482597.1 EVI5-like protein [Arthroderma uncinatum]